MHLLHQTLGVIEAAECYQSLLWAGPSNEAGEDFDGIRRPPYDEKLTASDGGIEDQTTSRRQRYIFIWSEGKR